MAEATDDPIPGPKLQGLKYLDKLLPLFERLHDVGCQRDRAGNRKLHYDQYCALILPSSSIRSCTRSACLTTSQLARSGPAQSRLLANLLGVVIRSR